MNIIPYQQLERRVALCLSSCVLLGTDEVPMASAQTIVGI